MVKKQFEQGKLQLSKEEEELIFPVLGKRVSHNVAEANGGRDETISEEDEGDESPLEDDDDFTISDKA